MPRQLRWSGMKPEEGTEFLSQLIDAEKSYNFWPYAYTHGESLRLLLCPVERKVSLVPRVDVLVGTYFLPAMIAPMLFPSKLEMVGYSPQRIL